MAIVEITLDAEAEGRVVPGTPEIPPGFSHGGLPAEGASVEDLRITLYLPARCIGRVDALGHVHVDVTSLVQKMDKEAAEDALVDESNGA